jgi:hypothetical protein
VAYAAYEPRPTDDLHPLLRRYPMPMIRACTDHLVGCLLDDAGEPGSTYQWLVTPATATSLMACEHEHEFDGVTAAHGRPRPS